MPIINLIWIAPLQMALYLYFMHVEIGSAIFVGLGIFLIAIPFNILIAKKAEKFQTKQMEYKDNRMKIMNEILGGIRVIKLQGWEYSFINNVQEIRGSEEKEMRKFAWVDVFTSLTFSMLPYLALLCSFATFIFMDEDNNILTAEKAFVTLSYMGQLSMQIISLPMTIVSVVQANVSLKRIDAFLCQEERLIGPIQYDAEEDTIVEIKGGSFKWTSVDNYVALEDINITIPKGSLTAVIGIVGAGKSSLLRAIIGDMTKLSGIINVVNDIAYVPQQPW